MRCSPLRFSSLPLRSLSCLVLASTACSRSTKTDPGVPDAPTPGIQVSVEAAIQRNGWGENLGRCEIKVAFTRPGETDGMMEGSGQLWDPLARPEADQECAVTIRDPVEMQAALDAQDPPEDNWVLEGQVYVGSSVTLEGSAHTLQLDAAYNDDGAYTGYQMAGCSEATFPFSEAFALVVPEGSPDDDIEPFRVENALATGPEIALVGLGAMDQVETSTAQQGVDFPIAWEFDGSIPTLDEPADHSVWLTVKNNQTDGVQEFEGVICLADPDDGSMPTSFVLPGDTLAELTPDETGDGALGLGLQLDSVTEGPDVTAPWGERIRVESRVSIDGTGSLAP